MTRRVPSQQDLVGFLDRCGPGSERDVAGEAGLVVVEHDSGLPHRFDDLESERSDLHLGALEWGEPGSVEAVLPSTGFDDTEGAVEDASVRVDGDADPEVGGAVSGVAVEPGPVVDVAIRAGRMGDRFRCLVDREVVEVVEHGGQATSWTGMDLMPARNVMGTRSTGPTILERG